MWQSLTLLCLLCGWGILANAQTVWKDDFKLALTANPNIDQGASSGVTWDGTSSYSPIVDPTTVDQIFLDIDGMWKMDSIITGTTPDASATNISGVINGDITLTPGKFGNALKWQGGTNAYLTVTPSPLTNQQALISGFSCSFWIKPDVYGGLIQERVYGAFALEMSAGHMMCTVRSVYADKSYYVYGDPISTGVWSHIACVYDPSQLTLYLYINGSLSNSAPANLTSGLRDGNGGILGLGSRPIVGSVSMKASLDEYILYKKALTAANVNKLYLQTTSVQPTLPPAFQSIVIPFVGTTTAYWSFTPTWSVTDQTAITVEISTNGGKAWCRVVNGVLYNGTTDICYMPAKNILYRVRFVKNAKLDSISFAFNDKEPVRTWKRAPIGINRQNTNYYDGSWMFVDVQKTAAIANSSYTFRPDFYPTQINSSMPYSWLVADLPGLKTGPRNLSLYADGKGVLQLDTRDGSASVGFHTTINLPADNPSMNVPVPYRITMASSDPADPIRNIRLITPGFEEIAASDAPFHPYYIESFQNFSFVRFMKTHTIDDTYQNLVYWEDRAKPNYFGQNFIKTNTWPIKSVTSAFDYPSLFCGDWKVMVVTSVAHNLTTGHFIDIYGADAKVKSWTTDGQVQTGFAIDGGMVEVINSTSFLLMFIDKHASWLWFPKVTGRNTIDFQPGTKGTVALPISSGISFEYSVKIAEKMNSDPYYCIPALASDSFIYNFATFLKANVNEKYKIYLEYGNELWNAVYIQYAYANRMAQKLNYPTSSEVVAKRSAEIWSIFDGVFGANSPRLVRVIPGFAAVIGYQDRIAAALLNTTINPNKKKADAIAIAPYFGAGVGPSYTYSNASMNAVTVDQILDDLRDSIYTDTLAMTVNNKALADQYGLRLISYEGGQHLIVPVSQNGPNFQFFWSKLNEANRRPFTYELYKQMYWIWAENGGQEFATFVDSGLYGQYGSFGLLEYGDAGDYGTLIHSYKYNATRDVMNLMRAMDNPSSSTATSEAPTGLPGTITTGATGTTGTGNTGTGNTGTGTGIGSTAPGTSQRPGSSTTGQNESSAVTQFNINYALLGLLAVYLLLM